MTVPTFPTLRGTSYPRVRSPWVDTSQLRSWSGRSMNTPKWAFPLYKYEIPINILSSTVAWSEWQNFVGFWNKVMTAPGQYFQYKDKEDNTATAQAFGTGDGVTTTFQLIRTVGGFAEPVTAPVTATVKVAGTVTAVTLNFGGTVTFASAPASGAALTWTGTFNWLCTFDDTSATMENFAFNYWSLAKIAFTTTRLT